MAKHVIFGTGPLGRFTAEALVAAGHQVVLVNRRGTMDAQPAGTQVVAGDVGNTAQTRQLIAGAAVAYFCAQPAYHRWVQEFPALQTSLVAACLAEKVALVAAENLYGYGRLEPGQKMTEDLPLRPCSKKGTVRAQMTAELWAARDRGLAVATVRGSDFFGPWDEIKGGMIFKPALTGKKVTILGRTDRLHTFTYAKDFGRTLAQVGLTPTAWGRTWHVPSVPAVTQGQFLKQIAAQVGRPVSSMTVGAVMASLIGLFDKTVAELPEMLYEFNQDFVMDSSAAEATFGLKATPIETQIRETLDWVKAHRLSQ